MKLRNKLFTTIGTLGAVVAPVAAVVACGDDETPIVQAAGEFDVTDNTFDVVMELGHAPLYYHVTDDQFNHLIKGTPNEEYTAKVATGGYNIGYDILLANRIAQKLSLNVKHPVSTLIHPAEWKNAIPTLLNNHYDSLIASMSVTEARAKLVKFSAPYLESTNGFLYRFGDVNGFSKFDKDTGVNQIIESTKPITLGALTGTIQETLLNDLAKVNKNITVVSKDLQEDLMKDFTGGKIDAVLMDNITKTAELNVMNKQTTNYIFHDGTNGVMDQRIQVLGQKDRTAAAFNPLIPKNTFDLVNKSIIDTKNKTNLAGLVDKINTFAIANNLK